MNMKLFDSELNIMEILWREGDMTAKRIAEITKENIGWSKTTTYTIIKKCLDKGATVVSCSCTCSRVTSARQTK